MGVEAVYWIALGVGLALLTLAVLLGDLLDALHVDLFDVGVPVAPVFFGAVAAFGAGGLLGIKAFELGTGGSVVTGVGAGVGVGFLVGLLFAALRRQESVEGFEISKLVGARGRVTLAVGPGRVGRAAVQFAGMTRSLSATSSEEISVGEEVVVLDTVGQVIKVARPRPAPSSATSGE